MKKIKKIKQLHYYSKLEQACEYLRARVAIDCKEIGIEDETIIDKMIETGNHKYVILSYSALDGKGNLIGECGYSVCLKPKKGR